MSDLQFLWRVDASPVVLEQLLVSVEIQTTRNLQAPGCVHKEFLLFLQNGKTLEKVPGALRETVLRFQVSLNGFQDP